MITHESIYDKENLKEISFKEFYNQQLQYHEEHKQNGKYSIKRYENGVLTYHNEYDKQHRILLQLVDIYSSWMYKPEIKIINFKNTILDKHYYKYYYIANEVNGKFNLKLILYKQINNTHKLRIIKYLDK